MANSEILRVVVCQMTSVDDVQTNLDYILKLLSSPECAQSDLVCFPENSLFLRVKEGTQIRGLELDHPAFRQLAEWAKLNDCVVHLGSVPLLRGSELFNSSVLIRPDGSVQDSYQKIHLFDVDVQGHKPVRESDVFSPGREVQVFDVRGWKIGSSICYDLRFAELYSKYAASEVDVILIPSAFLVPTGAAHWEILIRARAIESQAYVLAAAQGGRHHGVSGGERATYGHSLIVDPWGVILEECRENGPQTVRAELSRGRITQVRAQIPMKNHRRLV